MANESPGGQERTEQPTARRRQKAREEGQIARSSEVSTAFVLMSGAFVMAIVGASTFTNFARGNLVAATQALGTPDLGDGGLLRLMQRTGGGFLLAYLPFALGMGAIVLLVNLIQAKGVISIQPAMPKLSHLDPAKGLKRMVSGEAAFTGLKTILKLAAITLVTYFIISRTLPGLVSLATCEPAGIASAARTLILRLTMLMGASYMVLAALDYGFQHYRTEKNLRMSRQEVQYDQKDSEGDPHVKARMIGLARAAARRRMLKKVPEADVVVTNPTHVAVALKYDLESTTAPIVLAMGERKLAERIKKIARKHDVPLVENRPVARALLATAKVGRPIPPALYAAVAEILAFVYRRRKAWQGLPEPLKPRSDA